MGPAADTKPGQSRCLELSPKLQRVWPPTPHPRLSEPGVSVPFTWSDRQPLAMTHVARALKTPSGSTGLKLFVPNPASDGDRDWCTGPAGGRRSIPSTSDTTGDRSPVTALGSRLVSVTGRVARQSSAPPRSERLNTPPTSPTAVLVIGRALSLASTPARAGSPVPSNSGSIGGTRLAGPSALPPLYKSFMGGRRDLAHPLRHHCEPWGHGRFDRGGGNSGLRGAGSVGDPVAGTPLMVIHLILLGLAVVLLVYLGFAMFKPEAF